MKIKHISFSKSGGAGKVAERLFKQQIKIGLNAEFLWSIEGNLRENKYMALNYLIRAGIDNVIIKKNKYPSLFSYTRNIKYLNLEIKAQDILHLHWPLGIIDIFNHLHINQKNSKIIWTLHDYFAITGGCHLVQDCINFERGCIKCPAVKRIFQNIPEKVMKNKIHKIRELKNLIFVVPSQYVKNKITKSSILEKVNVTVIDNPLSQAFLSSNENILNKSKPLPRNNLVIGFIAREILDLNKRYIETKKILIEVSKAFNVSLTFLVIGQGVKEYEKVGNLTIITKSIASDEQMIQMINQMDLLLSSSISETFGLNVLEAASQGVPTIGIKNSATSELIINGETGFLVNQISDMYGVLCHLIHDNGKLESLRLANNNRDFSKYSVVNVNEEYLKLYESLI